MTKAQFNQLCKRGKLVRNGQWTYSPANSINAFKRGVRETVSQRMAKLMQIKYLCVFMFVLTEANGAVALVASATAVMLSVFVGLLCME